MVLVLEKFLRLSILTSCLEAFLRRNKHHKHFIAESLFLCLEHFEKKIEKLKKFEPNCWRIFCFLNRQLWLDAFRIFLRRILIRLVLPKSIHNRCFHQAELKSLLAVLAENLNCSLPFQLLQLRRNSKWESKFVYCFISAIFIHIATKRRLWSSIKKNLFLISFWRTHKKSAVSWTSSCW